MNSAALSAAIATPAGFRAALMIDVDGELRPLSEAMTPWQAERAEKTDPGWQRCIGRKVDGGFSRAYAQTVRGEGKTTLMAAEALWPLFAARRRVMGVAAAADGEQAGLIRDAIQRHLDCNAWLGKFITVNKNAVIAPSTGSELRVVTSDAATSFGWLLDYVCADELTCWRSEEFWSAVVSTIAKKPNAMLSIASNAGVGMGVSWQWRVWQACLNSPEWFISQVDVPTRTSAAHLAEQKLLLPPSAYSRLWENRWSTGAGDALSEEDLAACVKEGLEPLTGKERDWYFAGGLDIGVKKDWSSLCIVARHKKLATRRVARLCAWRPMPGKPVDLDEVETEVIKLAKQFRCPVGFDPHQCQQLAQRAHKAGVKKMIEVPFVGHNLHSMAAELVECVQGHNLAIPSSCKGLIDDLAKLNVVVRPQGWKLEAARTVDGHCDRAIALAIALNVIRETDPPKKAFVIFGDGTSSTDLIGQPQERWVPVRSFDDVRRLSGN